MVAQAARTAMVVQAAQLSITIFGNVVAPAVVVVGAQPVVGMARGINMSSSGGITGRGPEEAIRVDGARLLPPVVAAALRFPVLREQIGILPMVQVVAAAGSVTVVPRVAGASMVAVEVAVEVTLRRVIRVDATAKATVTIP